MQQALLDWKALLITMAARPTLCTDLVPAIADYHSYCDACKTGAGGVWFGANKALPPIIWCINFLVSIQEAMVSQSNPNGHTPTPTLKWQECCVSG